MTDFLDSINHGCSSEVWLIAISKITFNPLWWASSRKSLKKFWNLEKIQKTFQILRNFENFENFSLWRKSAVYHDFISTIELLASDCCGLMTWILAELKIHVSNYLQDVETKTHADTTLFFRYFQRECRFSKLFH